MKGSIEGPLPPGRGQPPVEKPPEKVPKGGFDVSKLPDIWPSMHFTEVQKKQFWNNFLNMISSQINSELQKTREAIKKLGEEYKEG